MLFGEGDCACNGDAVNESKNPVASKDTGTGMTQDGLDGRQKDDQTELKCSGLAWNGHAVQGPDGHWYVMIGGKIYRVKDPTKRREYRENVDAGEKSIFDIGDWDCATGIYNNLEEVKEDPDGPSWLDAINFGLGMLQGIADEVMGINEGLEAILDLIDLAVNDWEAFKAAIEGGLESIKKTIVDAASGNPDAIMAALGLLDYSVGNFLSLMILGKTLEGESSTPYLVGIAAGAVIVTVAIYIATSGGAGAAKSAAKTGGNLAKKAGDSIGDIAKNCFIAGTLVWVLKDGLTLEEALALLARGAPIWMVCDIVPIEQIEAGVYVLSRHESSDTAPLTFSRVQCTFSSTAESALSLFLLDKQSRHIQEIGTTPGHPFWVASSDGSFVPPADLTADHTGNVPTYTTGAKPTAWAESGWVFANDIQVGQFVETTSRREAVVVGKRVSSTPTKVYNIEVRGTHTYFVTDSRRDSVTEAVWAHNMSAGKGSTRRDGKGQGKKNQEIKDKRKHEHMEKKKKKKETAEERRARLQEEWNKLPAKEKRCFKDFDDWVTSFEDD